MINEPLDMGVRVAATQWGGSLINPMPMLARMSYETGRLSRRSVQRRKQARTHPHRKGRH